MKTCRDCPHIALDRWPNGKAAVRCWCSENGDKLGRVLHVTSEGNPHPDSVATPKWCRRGDNPSDNPSAGLTAATSPYTGEARGTGARNKEGDIR